MKNSKEHSENQQIPVNLSEPILTLVKLSNNTYKHGLFVVLFIIFTGII